jgi:glycosyltransferase involved in cell wall biosynthesis
VRVTFVLPGFRPRPIGGFLVVYRYANELVERGHEVNVVHPRRIERTSSLWEGLKSRTWRQRKRVRYRSRPPWFELDPRVETTLLGHLENESLIPTADAIFATACNTAASVLRFGPAKGTKFYLVQHYEDWVCGKEGVEETWRMPMHKIVSSRWLLDIGIGLGETERLTHIPYGVELDVFQRRVPPAARSPVRVGMLAHHQPFKGMRYGIDALGRIRDAVPEIEAVAFGAGTRPKELPDWVKYIENPTRPELVTLYNSLAIFIHTSVTEGWGLTGAEALACGCALVAADSGGVRDYALDGHTALLVPPRDAAGLASRVTELIEDPALRFRISEAGHKLVQNFTWARAADRLEEVIREATRSRHPGASRFAVAEGVARHGEVRH